MLLQVFAGLCRIPFKVHNRQCRLYTLGRQYLLIPENDGGIVLDDLVCDREGPPSSGTEIDPLADMSDLSALTYLTCEDATRSIYVRHRNVSAGAISGCDTTGSGNTTGWFSHDKSLIDSEEFFLSPYGRSSPEDELEATLRGLFDSASRTRGNDPRHPQCAFPARLAWLTERLAIDPKQLPIVDCPELKQWLASRTYQGILSRRYPAALRSELPTLATSFAAMRRFGRHGRLKMALLGKPLIK